MLERRAGPPVMGLLFLATVAASVGWAAMADTDPVIDRQAAPALVIEQAAGTDRSRTAEFARRAILEP